MNLALSNNTIISIHTVLFQRSKVDAKARVALTGPISCCRAAVLLELLHSLNHFRKPTALFKTFDWFAILSVSLMTCTP
jgi:hypothetical protein